ncbi:MAG: Sigma 54 modulation protein/ribosomal protein [Frankiales bacterium]|nr:Sigma 54 modulation protein/ribosomal protein [Frankiales bacterium]
MGLRVSGKNFSIGESLRGHVHERIENAAAKYFDGSVTGHVVVDHEGSGYRTDCMLHLASGMTLHSEGRAHEPYASFEQAADRLEARLRRYKTRLKGHHGTHASTQPMNAETVSDYTIEPPGPDHAEEETYHPAVIAETTRALKEQPVSEAVRDLDLSGAPVLIFKHSTSGRVNIVYRRPDGNIGWLDPEGPERKAGRS